MIKTTHSCFNLRRLFSWTLCVLSLVTGTKTVAQSIPGPEIISYVVDLQKQDMGFYWKDDSGRIFESIQNLKEYMDRRHKRLVFAMNGGMFKPDHSPQGLYIQQRALLAPLDTNSGNGNFYMKPNGVLYITTANKAVVCSTKEFKNSGQIKFATQSGPLLLINGAVHPGFRAGSANVNIRNGVGIISDHHVLFAMSVEPINFYDFAEYFRQHGCQNALYLDGFVSRTYLPEKKWIQTDGDFGVIIAVVSK
jgi:uncharacterized protein YigE (DUF2233 family)